MQKQETLCEIGTFKQTMNKRDYVEKFKNLLPSEVERLDATQGIYAALQLEATVERILRFLLLKLPSGVKLNFTPGIMATFQGAMRASQLSAPTLYEYYFVPDPERQTFIIRQRVTGSKLFSDSSRPPEAIISLVSVKDVLGYLFDSSALVTLVINMQIAEASSSLSLLAEPLFLTFSHNPVAVVTSDLEFNIENYDMFLQKKNDSFFKYKDFFLANQGQPQSNWINEVTLFDGSLERPYPEEEDEDSGPPPLRRIEEDDDGPPPLRPVPSSSPAKRKQPVPSSPTRSSDDDKPRVSSIQKAKATREANEEKLQNRIQKIRDQKASEGNPVEYKDAKEQAIAELQREKDQLAEQTKAEAAERLAERRKEQNDAKQARLREIAEIKEKEKVSRRNAERLYAARKRQKQVDAMDPEERAIYEHEQEQNRLAQEFVEEDDEDYADRLTPVLEQMQWETTKRTIEKKQEIREAYDFDGEVRALDPNEIRRYNSSLLAKQKDEIGESFDEKGRYPRIPAEDRDFFFVMYEKKKWDATKELIEKKKLLKEELEEQGKLPRVDPQQIRLYNSFLLFEEKSKIGEPSYKEGRYKAIPKEDRDFIFIIAEGIFAKTDETYFDDAERFVEYRKQLEVELQTPYRASIGAVKVVDNKTVVTPYYSDREDYNQRIQDEVETLKKKARLVDQKIRRRIQEKKNREYKKLLQTVPAAPRPSSTLAEEEEAEIAKQVQSNYTLYVVSEEGLGEEKSRKQEIYSEMQELKNKPVVKWEIEPLPKRVPVRPKRTEEEEEADARDTASKDDDDDDDEDEEEDEDFGDFIEEDDDEEDDDDDDDDRDDDEDEGDEEEGISENSILNLDEDSGDEESDAASADTKRARFKNMFGNLHR
jgi:hypothetical protein